MRCASCQSVCSDLRDICPKCFVDLRPLKKSLSLPISNPNVPYELLVERTAKKLGARKSSGNTASNKGMGGWLMSFLSVPTPTLEPKQRSTPEPLKSSPAREASAILAAPVPLARNEEILPLPSREQVRPIKEEHSSISKPSPSTPEAIEASLTPTLDALPETVTHVDAIKQLLLERPRHAKESLPTIYKADESIKQEPPRPVQKSANSDSVALSAGTTDEEILNTETPALETTVAERSRECAEELTLEIDFSTLETDSVSSLPCVPGASESELDVPLSVLPDFAESPAAQQRDQEEVAFEFNFEPNEDSLETVRADPLPKVGLTEATNSPALSHSALPLVDSAPSFRKTLSRADFETVYTKRGETFQGVYARFFDGEELPAIGGNEEAVPSKSALEAASSTAPAQEQTKAFISTVPSSPDDHEAILFDELFDAPLEREVGVAFEISFEQIKDFSANREEITLLFDILSDSIDTPDVLKRLEERVVRSDTKTVEAEELTSQLKQVQGVLDVPLLSLRSTVSLGKRSGRKSSDDESTINYEVIEASVARRLGALIIDTALMLMFSLIGGAWYLNRHEESVLQKFLDLSLPSLLECASMLGVVSAVFCVLVTFYPLINLRLFGATPGMRLLKLFLLRSDGKPLELSHYWVRCLTLPVSLISLTFLPLFWGARPLHDRLACTVLSAGLREKK